MYFFLLLNSSFVWGDKLSSVLLGGSLLYMITHALIFNTTLIPILRDYYWNVLFIDIFITMYYLYNNNDDIRLNISAIKNVLPVVAAKSVSFPPISQLNSVATGNPFNTVTHTPAPAQSQHAENVVNIATLLDENKSVASDIASIMDLSDF